MDLLPKQGSRAQEITDASRGLRFGTCHHEAETPMQGDHDCNPPQEQQLCMLAMWYGCDPVSPDVSAVEAFTRDAASRWTIINTPVEAAACEKRRSIELSH